MNQKNISVRKYPVVLCVLLLTLSVPLFLGGCDSKSATPDKGSTTGSTKGGKASRLSTE